MFNPSVSLKRDEKQGRRQSDFLPGILNPAQLATVTAGYAAVSNQAYLHHQPDFSFDFMSVQPTHANRWIGFTLTLIKRGDIIRPIP
jgi:hypothetical protein